MRPTLTAGIALVTRRSRAPADFARPTVPRCFAKRFELISSGSIFSSGISGIARASFDTPTRGRSSDGAVLEGTFVSGRRGGRRRLTTMERIFESPDRLT